jgi:hypothetical protein
MECTTCDGPHPQCSPYSRYGFGSPLVRRGVERGMPRLWCPLWKRPVSARHGTASCGVHAEEPPDPIALRALAEGHARRGTGRIVDVDQETVCDGRDRAGRHGRAVTTSRCDNWPSTECQGDAWWRVVRQQAAQLTVAETVRAR